MRIADPRPALCTACGNSGSESTRFVDCDAVREGPVVLDKESGQIAIGPDGAVVTLDDVFLCDACVREARSVLGFAAKPERVAELERENRQLGTAVEHWRAYSRRLEQTLFERPEPAPSAPRRRERVAA